MPGANPAAEGSFRAHLRYLQAWDAAARAFFSPKANVSRSGQEVLAGIANVLAADSALAAVQRRASDADGVRKFLFNAWGTELLLALQEELAPTEEELEVVALANQWAVVQAFYAVENATVALVIASGNIKPDTHEKTRTMYADRWGGRCYGPFSVIYTSNGLEKLPADEAAEAVHVWENVHERNCWGFIDTCLRTTRRDLLQVRHDAERTRRQQANRRSWQLEEKQRLAAGKKARVSRDFGRPLLTAGEKYAIDAALRPTTFLDYLYRLRIRSNYEDTTMFTEGPGSNFEAVQMHRYLSRLVAWNLLVIEAWIRRYLGAASFDPMVADWLTRKVATSVDVGVMNRRPHLVTRTPDRR